MRNNVSTRTPISSQTGDQVCPFAEEDGKKPALWQKSVRKKGDDGKR
jgi:hypothetical protein